MVNSKGIGSPEQTENMFKTPIKWCSVSLSDVIFAGKRIDATTFDIELIQAKESVQNSIYPTTTIIGKGGLCDAYRPGICKRIFVKPSASSIPMLIPSQVTDLYPKAEKHLSAKMEKEIKNWYVQSHEVLLTCSGTVGRLSFVSRTLDQKCVSQNLIRLVAKDENTAGYVYAYLNTKVGQIFLTRNNYGAVIQHIDPDHLLKVPVPDAPDVLKKRIHDLIVASYELRDESNELLDQAHTLLVEELQLPAIEDFDVKYFRRHAPVDTYSVKLSDMAGRLDASYHVPIVSAIIKHLQEHAAEVTSIGDHRISSEVILPGRFKRVYVEEGFGRVFIGGKQLWELDPSNKKYLSLIHHGDRITKQLELHENMTLITCSGTIGKVALVGKHWENWAANQHIIRVVPANDEIAGYLNVFLSSEYGYQLITHFTYGSVVDEIDDNHVRQIPIPLLKDKSVQDRINALALEANKKRYEAYLLEQQAIEIMNNEVIFAK